MASFSLPYAKICASNRRIGSVSGISTQQWQQQQQSNNISFPSSASQNQSSIWRMHATNNEIVPISPSEPYSLITDIMGKASGLFKLINSRDLTLVHMNFDSEIDIGRKEASIVKSTADGIFHISDKPTDGKPYVEVGDEVMQGTTLCKITKATEAGTTTDVEIKATESGTIFNILAKDKDPVKVGMPLFVIVPSDKKASY